MAEAPKMTIAFYRGYTHGEFAIAPHAPVGSFVGNWVRNNLADKEYIPKGWKWDKLRGMRVYNSFAHWEVKRLYSAYEYTTNRLHVPIAFCDDIIREIESWGGEVKEIPLPNYKLRKIDTKMNPKFTDRPWQVDLIKKCSELDFGMKGLALQTGRGKTYSATKAAVNLGYATMVICPGLVDQWIKSILEQTDCKNEDVYKLEGFDSFARLTKMPGYKPKFFVASIRTMQMFCKGDEGYELLPWDYTKFFAEYGIGTKIVDECHLNFHANTIMDLASNVPYNLYCSATFDQNSKHAKVIFDKIFPESIRYGMQNYDKYVTSYFYNISSEVDEKKCTRAQRYMHVLYEAQLLKSTQRFESHVRDVFLPIINQHYIERVTNDKQKMLIFCSSIEFVKSVVGYLQKVYPDKRVISYLGGDKKDSLDKGDIIVSTVGKAAVGLDIKGLITVMNSVSIASPPMSTQLFGRLRRVDDTTVVYADICDINFQAQQRHAMTRKELIRKFSAKYYEYNGLYDPIVQDGSIPSAIPQLF